MERVHRRRKEEEPESGAYQPGRSKAAREQIGSEKETRARGGRRRRVGRERATRDAAADEGTR